MERLGLITVDMQNATAAITGDEEFFYGDNNSIEIEIINATEEIGDVCYFCANQIGQLYVGNTQFVDGKYVIDKENMDYILNVCGEVIIQIQIFNTGNKRITCSNNIYIQSLLNFDRKKFEVLTPDLQVNLAELLELAEKIASGEIDVTPGAGTGTGKDGVTFTPYVSPAGIISWTNDGGLKNPTPVSIMGPQGPVGPQGIQGESGQDGKDGTSIFSITRKEEDSNIIIVTLTDASSFEIEIPTVAGKDGKDGAQGPAGPTGERGEKGEKGDTGEQGPAGADGKDYVLTENDKQEIAQAAAALVPTGNSNYRIVDYYSDLEKITDVFDGLKVFVKTDDRFSAPAALETHVTLNFTETIKDIAIPDLSISCGDTLSNLFPANNPTLAAYLNKYFTEYSGYVVKNVWGNEVFDYYDTAAQGDWYYVELASYTINPNWDKTYDNKTFVYYNNSWHLDEFDDSVISSEIDNISSEIGNISSILDVINGEVV